MTQKKCPVCGTVLESRFTRCTRCGFFKHREDFMFESCTGVRYPCSNQCRPCFFEEIYKNKKIKVWLGI